MAWAVAGTMAGVGLLSGALNAKAQANAQDKAAQINAIQTKYSPWTGIKPQGFQPQAVNGTGQALGGALSGGLAGLMMKQAAAGKKPGIYADNTDNPLAADTASIA